MCNSKTSEVRLAVPWRLRTCMCRHNHTVVGPGIANNALAFTKNAFSHDHVTTSTRAGARASIRTHSHATWREASSKHVAHARLPVQACTERRNRSTLPNALDRKGHLHIPTSQNSPRPSPSLWPLLPRQLRFLLGLSLPVPLDPSKQLPRVAAA